MKNWQTLNWQKITANWQKITAPLLSLGMTTLIGLPAIAQTATSATAERRTLIAQIAPTEGECRLVTIDTGGLNVRQQPSIFSSVVGVLADGADVTIESLGENGWVPISEPLNGFVAAEHLTSCGGVGGATPIPDDCREIDAVNGLNIRREPSRDSAVVDALANGRTINITEERSDGWVGINSPLQGYVYGDYLDYCSAAQAERLR